MKESVASRRCRHSSLASRTSLHTSTLTTSVNNDEGRDNIKNASDVADIVSDHAFGGSTKLGTKLWDRVFGLLVLELAYGKNLAKPVLVMIIIDGEVMGGVSTMFWDGEMLTRCIAE